MRKHITLICSMLLWINTSLLFCGMEDVIIQSGHRGIINELIHHPAKPVLFSAGEDGTVKIWDTDSGELLRSIRVHYRPVKHIAIHPLLPYCAVLEIIEPLSSRLSVWNWETGEKKYEIDLKQIPLFFTFSTKGNYLVYGKSEWKSLSFHKAETGELLPLFPDGFGLVSYATFSKTEKNIMTYQPSGKIMYWEIKSQNQLLADPVATLSNLTAISISDKKTFIAASTGEKLVIIDLLSGKVVTQADIKSIASTAILGDGKEILCISKNEGNSVLNRFEFTGKDLIRVAEKVEGPFLTQLATPVYGKETIYFSSPDGTILNLKIKNPPEAAVKNSLEVFSHNELAAISDIALTKKLIAIGNSEKILSFPLYFLDTGTENVDIADFNYYLYENLFRTDIGLSFYNPIKLLTWSRNSDPIEFNIRNIKTGDIVEEFTKFSSPLIQLELLENGIITLERDGLCAIRDKTTFQPQFEYKAKGLNKIVYISDSLLIGARSKLNRFESPLISINPQTGETVSLSDPALLCYDLVFHQKTNSLFSLSIGSNPEDSNAGSITQLKMHQGRGYELEKVLFSFAGEDLTASLVSAPTGDYVYTSLGYSRIVSWDGRKLSEFPECPHIPRKLYIADKLLLSLNRDLSISIWDRFKQERMLDLYLFADYTWIAVLADGEYVTSIGAEKHIKVPAK
ncbi:MAG: hypothetical protein JXJ04_26185 [Spirochaetales bacterium]|nr:hypothetical protein [Spirochaetales bacterium]